MSKSQVSVEYTIIMGFVAVITVPLIIIYFDYTSISNDEIVSRQLMQVAQKIVDSAESIYYLGEPSQTTVKVHIPDNVYNASIELEREVVFRVKTRNGLSDIIQISNVNITGSLPSTQGIHYITIKAKENKVEFSYN